MAERKPASARDVAADSINEMREQIIGKQVDGPTAIGLAQALATLAVADAITDLANAVRYTRDGRQR